MSTSTSKNRKAAFAGGPQGRSTVNKSRKGTVPASVGSQSRMGKSIYGGASRTVLSSASRRNVQMAGSEKLGPGGKPPPQVMDETGNDVTPLPLLQLDPNVVRKNQSNIIADSSAGTPTDLMSQASMYQGTVNASTFGGPFTSRYDSRSVFSASQSGRSTGSLSDDLAEPTQDSGPSWTETKVQYKREEVKEELSEDDLDKVVNLELTETETIWLLDMPGVCVSLESEEAESVREQNQRYQELIKSRVGNDRYSERGMNTFNDAPKLKYVQTTKIGYNEVGIMATQWDMYDTYQLVEELEAKAKAAEEESGEGGGTISRPVSAAQLADAASEKADSEKSEKETDTGGSKVAQTTVQEGLESQGTMVSSIAGMESVFSTGKGGEKSTTTEDVANINEKQILESEKFKRDLVTMERVVNLNTYQQKQASYRGFEILPEENEEEPKKPTKISVHTDVGPNLDRLWAYQCPLTKGRNVSYIAWNKQNPDLLAVAYGQFEFTEQKSGVICCWSLKNPEFPERVYTCPSGVTALDFSVGHANLLAVGMYDGTVAIYNVRTTDNEPVLDSLESQGKHTGPVWQLKWIEKERGSGEEKAEGLVSVSTDGRVTQWSIRKGFESYDLMKLKRVTPKTGSSKKKTEALISKHAGGLCFDFNAKDTNIYLTGTEDGHIHKCSCSYNEQYLDSYFGHTGPVYAIQWSPFNPDVFLSCSGDWSIRLWHQDRTAPVLNFHSSTKSVPSVCWSPKNSTVFACVNEGSVEVWDLSQSTLDPIIVNSSRQGVKMSSVTFAHNSDSLLVGDSEGHVSVYELKGMNKIQDDDGQALKALVESSLANQLQAKK